jgi:SAM-dependent methyltransferase
MATAEWIRNEFRDGYDSGNILSIIPNRRRFHEERLVGGSYRKIFRSAILPYVEPTSTVGELGPGRGSWSKAILDRIPAGVLHTFDYLDSSQWLRPETYGNRLVCHQVEDNSFSSIGDDVLDFFWSFGVLCHNSVSNIEIILDNSLRKMRPGGVAVHQYGDWEKLERFGWERGSIPVRFKGEPDDQIWWPRNDQKVMSNIARETGWLVVNPDLDLIRRDSIIVLRRPD